MKYFAQVAQLLGKRKPRQVEAFGVPDSLQMR